MSVFACLLLLLLPLQSSSGDVVVRGLYSNYDYGYSVSIPKGLSGFRAAAPAPNHGFGIALSENPKSFVWVDASYNAAFWKSFNDAIQAHMEHIKDRGVNVELVQKERTRIASLPAIRFIIEYNTNSDERMVNEIILAFRTDPGGVGIVYTVELDSIQSRYRRDRNILAVIHRSWQLRRLP